MIEFNDSNAFCTANGISVFLEPVNTDEDIYISSSCLFLSDLVTTGHLKAQYHLMVKGALSVINDIEIGGNLECTSLKASNVTINGRLFVKDDVTCNNLFVTGDAFVGSVFSNSIDIRGTLVSTGMIDATGTTTVEKALICLDSVQVSDTLSTHEIIADDISVTEEHVFRKYILSQDILTENQNANLPQSLESSQPSDIFDAHSLASIEMDNCAVFLERLNDEVCTLQFDDDKLHDLLSAYGGFFPDYDKIYQSVVKISDVLTCNVISDATWYSDFNCCVEVLISLPKWFLNSTVAKEIQRKILDLLQYQTSHAITTESLKTWSASLYFTKVLQNIYADDDNLSSLLYQLKNRLLSNISLKPTSIELLFPNE